MTGPRNGGTRPTSVATPMSQGSAIRRRASLNVQYAVASQRSTSTTSAVFFVSDQPCDPEMASRANIVRAEACRPNSRVQRMCRRAQRRRLARTSPLPGARLPSTRRVLLLRAVAEEAARPGHEHGLAELVGTCERRDGAADPHVVPCDEVSPFVVREHDDGAVLHDGELLSRDLRARLTQDLRVLEGDVREQDDARPKDVRRVEAPTETGLDDGVVDVRIRECEERRPRDDLELRRPPAPGRGADRLH